MSIFSGKWIKFPLAKVVIISTIALHLPFICVKLKWQHNLYFICKAYICDRCVVIWKIYSIMDTYVAIGKDNVSTGEISWLMESSFSELPQFWSNKSLINHPLNLQTSVSYKVSENELRFHGLFFGLGWVGLGFFCSFVHLAAWLGDFVCFINLFIYLFIFILLLTQPLLYYTRICILIQYMLKRLCCMIKYRWWSQLW